MEKTCLKEVVELFVNTTFSEIKREIEIPNINFIFEEDAYELFNYVMNNPYTEEGYWIPDIDKNDIENIKNKVDKDVPTIYVNNAELFFLKLTEIINKTLILYDEYNEQRLKRNMIMLILRRIWLRMGIDDFNNVNLFLDKQIEFLDNRLLDTYEKEVEYKTFENYKVFIKTIANRSYDESTRRMIIMIKDNSENEYTLPTILYDIDNNDICYIYGIQNINGTKSKKIERSLYKINKGIENPNVHPNKIYSMKIFLDLLKNNGIKKIRIPSMQILSYRYHELLSIDAKDSYDNLAKKLKMWPDDKHLNYMFKETKEWLDKVYNKENIISYLKTEELFNVAYRFIDNKELDVLNDINIEGDYLDLRLKK